MSNIISIHYLLQFLVFIYIIPVYFTLETKLKIIFLNGFNVIRCSDNQVQVYQPNGDEDVTFSEIFKCDNKDDLYYDGYSGFIWTDLTLSCSSDGDQVHEEQLVKRENPGEVISLPHALGQLDQSTGLYQLLVKHAEEEDIFAIRSNEQPANDAYFVKNSDTRLRRIYIWFADHPIICRLQFTGNEDNPCPSMDNKIVDNVDYTCYYNPGAGKAPTKDEMEAELKQIEEANKPDDSAAYVLDLNIPVCIECKSFHLKKGNSVTISIYMMTQLRKRRFYLQ
jgi:hypothetical protein